MTQVQGARLGTHPTIGPSKKHILYLDRDSVSMALRHVDAIQIVQSVLEAHSRKQTHLPAEAYLGWLNGQGEWVRSLNMPGAVVGAQLRAGTKIINANPSNLRRGLPRADGILALFCAESGQIQCLMQGAQISSLRTAAVSVVATRALSDTPPQRLALLGAGVQAQAHAEAFLSEFKSSLCEVAVYDTERARTRSLCAALSANDNSGCQVRAASSAQDACYGADVIVPVTTTTVEYLQIDWLQAGSLVVNVSLSDLTPESFLVCDRVFVDDWELVAADRRRTLGRLIGEGHVVPPSPTGPSGPGDPRSIDGELGDVLTGAVVGRTAADQRIIVNPFGLSIEDVSVGYEVMVAAIEHGLGIGLPR